MILWAVSARDGTLGVLFACCRGWRDRAGGYGDAARRRALSSQRQGAIAPAIACDAGDALATGHGATVKRAAASCAARSTVRVPAAGRSTAATGGAAAGGSAAGCAGAVLAGEVAQAACAAQ